MDTSEKTFVYFHYWLNKLTSQDFDDDLIMPIAKRLYEAINPIKVTDDYNFPNKELKGMPWEK